jgi:hypothetical protein
MWCAADSIELSAVSNALIFRKTVGHRTFWRLHMVGSPGGICLSRWVEDIFMNLPGHSTRVILNSGLHPSIVVDWLNEFWSFALLF